MYTLVRPRTMHRKFSFVITKSKAWLRRKWTHMMQSKDFRFPQINKLSNVFFFKSSDRLIYYGSILSQMGTIFQLPKIYIALLHSIEGGMLIGIQCKIRSRAFIWSPFCFIERIKIKILCLFHKKIFCYPQNFEN